MKGVLRCIWLVNQCLARNEWIGASSVRSEIFLPLMQLKFTVRSNKTGFKLWFLTVRGLNLDCRFLFSKSHDLELSFFLKRFPLTFIEAYEFFSRKSSTVIIYMRVQFGYSRYHRFDHQTQALVVTMENCWDTCKTTGLRRSVIRVVK